MSGGRIARVLTYERYDALLQRDTDAFADLVAEGDLATTVPSCPGWSLADLASHLGGVHRWAAAAIRDGRPGEEPAGPREQAALAAWYAQSATELLELLRATDPMAPAWNFGPPPRTAGFWWRRQALETAVHLWDARRALGQDAPLDDDLAADGVAEVATMFFPRQVRLERIPPLAAGLRVEVQGGEAYVLAGDGTDPAAPTTATVAGSAGDLLLALWGRADVADLTVDGDPAVARAVLAAGIVP